MKTRILRGFSFIGKSLLWSLLLYFLSMAVLNWDDISRDVYKNGVSHIAAVHIIPGPGGQAVIPENIEGNGPSQEPKDIKAPSLLSQTMETLRHIISTTAKLLPK